MLHNQGPHAHGLAAVPLRQDSRSCAASGRTGPRTAAKQSSGPLSQLARRSLHVPLPLPCRAWHMRHQSGGRQRCTWAAGFSGRDLVKWPPQRYTCSQQRSQREGKPSRCARFLAGCTGGNRALLVPRASLSAAVRSHGPKPLSLERHASLQMSMERAHPLRRTRTPLPPQHRVGAVCRPQECACSTSYGDVRTTPPEPRAPLRRWSQ